MKKENIYTYQWLYRLCYVPIIAPATSILLIYLVLNSFRVQSRSLNYIEVIQPIVHRDNLYRRSSDIYVFHIALSSRYRNNTGQREIHASIETNDIRKARVIVTGLLVVWQRCLGEYQKLGRKKLVSSTPALLEKE